ncbi:MAG: response regulator [Gammaproteobacteria bacterium]|jgi:two-component system, chemotaxis family, chemotaxis protein CheY|nr:response regulator [Gammaproteobacteria bacterium]
MNKILAVDDSASLRGAITFALTKLGKFDIVEAEDGAHALGVIDQHREQGTSTFDLILVDVNMPKMNGFEMIEQVREMPDYRFTPILFLTTENSNESKAKGRKLNATGWITKPFSPENLLGIVERVLHK